MSPTEYFADLFEEINLKIGDEERKAIEEKQSALREKLREKLLLEDDFLTGSYKRHTIIKPKSDQEKFDVDVFVAFRKDEYEESELSDLRDVVVDALHKIESEDPNLGITLINEGQRRSVGVEFGSSFQVDVVPAVQIEKDKLYKIFDQRILESVKSNPKLHGQLLTEANEKVGGQLVPLIKVLKAWKRQKCDYVKSFHIELMAVKIFQGGEMKTLSDGLLSFFEASREFFSKASLKDPANNEMLIDEYLDKDGTRDQVCALVETEYAVAKAAVEAEKAGNNEEAVKKWEKIFSDPEAETAKAIRENSFFPVAGGAVIKTNASKYEVGRIDSPRSWGE